MLVTPESPCMGEVDNTHAREKRFLSLSDTPKSSAVFHPEYCGSATEFKPRANPQMQRHVTQQLHRKRQKAQITVRARERPIISS